MDGAQQTFGMQHRSLYQYPQTYPQKYPNFHIGTAGIPAALASSSLLEKPADLVSKKPVSSSPPSISYRHVQPSDLGILQEIHEALFPIKYEKEFFLNVVYGKGIVAWAAIDTNRSERHGDELVGFVTARITKATEAEGEDILGYDVSKTERTLIYILTLGVVKPYRNFGIASALVWQVIEYASRIPSCRAVYLHVISYNRTAIVFYQKNAFRCLRRLTNFYHINGCFYDAYLYIYYVNGGRSPCSAIDFLAAVGAFLKNAVTSLASKFCHQADERLTHRAKLIGP